MYSKYKADYGASPTRDSKFPKLEEAIRECKRERSVYEIKPKKQCPQ
jgi:hypothetical protein